MQKLKCAVSYPHLFRGVYPRVLPHYVAQSCFEFLVISCLYLNMSIADMDHHTQFMSNLEHLFPIPVPTTVLTLGSCAAIKHHDYKKTYKGTLLNKINPKLYNYPYVYQLCSTCRAGRRGAIWCQKIDILAETIPGKPISSTETQLIIHRRTNFN